MPLIPGKGHVGENIKEFRQGNTFAHTENKFGKDRADKQAVAVALHHEDKGGHEDPKAAISKMHPHHLHKLVKAAHEGKFGPEAKGMAQQAMQPGPAGGADGDGDGDEVAAPQTPQRNASAIFGGGQEPDQDDEQPSTPQSRASVFAGRSGGM